MKLIPADNGTTLQLASLLGGILVAISLTLMIQLLSAVHSSDSDNNQLLIINLLELPQKQFTLKTVEKKTKTDTIQPVKKKPPEKKEKVEAIVKNTSPDITNLSKNAYVESSNENIQAEKNIEHSLPQPTPYFKLSDLPRFLHRETPVYPEDMRANGSTGVVELAVLIDGEGKVREITILKSAGESFDQAAINAINASTFQPARAGGKPVTSLLKMPVKFKLL